MQPLRQFPLRSPEWLPSTLTYGEQKRPQVPVPPSNLAVNPGFTGSLGGWTVFGGGIAWDGNVGRNAPGTARMDGDGTYNRDLISTGIRVTPGMVMTCSVWIGFAGMDSHGQEPIHLAGLTGLADVVVDYPVIDTMGPMGDSGATLYQLAGQFTIPQGVDGFALRLSMRDVATGTCWWDDAEVWADL